MKKLLGAVTRAKSSRMRRLIASGRVTVTTCPKGAITDLLSFVKNRHLSTPQPLRPV